MIFVLISPSFNTFTPYVIDYQLSHAQTNYLANKIFPDFSP
jgi:hypothetical protein